MNVVVRTGTAALAFAIFAVASAFVTPRALAQEEGGDTITKKDNSKVAGQIKSEDTSGCKITVGKAELAVGWNQIKTVDYGGSPEFRQARRFTDLGDTKNAVPLLEKLRKENQRDVLKPHVLNLLGLNYYRDGQSDKAIEAYNELFGKYPKTQLIAAGGENLVNCYLAKQDAAGADAALQKMVSAGVDTSQLGLLKAHVLEAKKSWQEAASGYKSVKDSASDPQVKAAADLGIARCQLGQNKGGDAESTFRGLVGNDTLPNVILAGAWNGLGDVTYKTGFDKRDPEMLTNALYQYLRGCVQYAPSSGDPTTEYEHSLWGASRCFDALSQIETKPESKKTLAQKARERLDLLKTKFPSSEYAK